jgi:pimeloyl-ACP methyl ester carboxylesterase
MANGDQDPGAPLKNASVPWWAFLPGVLLLGLGACFTWLGRVDDCVVEDHTLVDGDTEPIRYRLYIPSHRDSPSPGVLLAHGINNNKQTMELLALELARRHMVAMTFDFGGHGGSYRREHDADQDAEDLRRTLAALTGHRSVDPEQLAIIGHSIGARAAVQVAREDDRVRAVVAISMSIDAGPHRPNNLLLAAGIYDQCYAPRYLSEDLQRATGKDLAEADVVYGSFDQGTARQLCLSPQTDHLLAPYDPRLIRATASWIERSVGRKPDRAVNARVHWLAAARSCLIAGASLLVFLIALAGFCRWMRRSITSKSRRVFALVATAAVLLPIACCWLIGGCGGLLADLSMIILFGLLATNLLLRAAVSNRGWLRHPMTSMCVVAKLTAILFLAWWLSVLLCRIGYLWRSPAALGSVGVFGAEVLGFLPHHLLLKLRSVLYAEHALVLLPSLVLSIVLLAEVLIPGEISYVVCSVLGVILGAMRVRRRHPAAGATAKRAPSKLVRIRQALLLAVLAVLVVLLYRRLMTVGPDVRSAMGQLALRMFVVPLAVVFALVNLPRLGLSLESRRMDCS